MFASNPSSVGARSELAIATALSDAGFAVFTPFFSSHSRIDLVYAKADGSVHRVQCKTARLSDGFISFFCCSNTGGVRRTYRDDVDEFGVYCADTGDVYLVPVRDVPTREARLRIAPTKSKQLKGIRWADQYVLRRGGAATSV